MDIVLVPLLRVLIKILQLYNLLLIAYVILGWLEIFGIVNRYNNFIYLTHNFLFSVTEPVLGPLRKIIPSLGGVDLSPIIVFFAINFLQDVMISIINRFPGG